MINKSTRSLARHHGFSLIELMIAMVIGLILLAGVGTVFVSTQQTSQTKRGLDNAQEALRYTHQSISRMVRIGEIDAASDDEQLVITFDRAAATPDCLGGIGIATGMQVVYALNQNALECTVVGGQTAVIARNITAFTLEYESLDGNTWTGANGADAVSVQVSLTFGDLIATSFVATSRAQVMDGYFALANE